MENFQTKSVSSGLTDGKVAKEEVEGFFKNNNNNMKGFRS